MASLRAEELPSGTKSYAVRYVDPKTKKLRNKRFKTHAMARAFKSKVEHEINTGAYTDAAPKATGTVADVVDSYIVTNPRVKESTREQYKARRAHVVDKIGKLQIQNLERSDVEAWRDELVNDPDVGVSAAFDAGRLLEQTLNFAVKNGHLGRQSRRVSSSRSRRSTARTSLRKTRRRSSLPPRTRSTSKPEGSSGPSPGPASHLRSVRAACPGYRLRGVTRPSTKASRRLATTFTSARRRPAGTASHRYLRGCPTSSVVTSTSRVSVSTTSSSPDSSTGT